MRFGSEFPIFFIPSFFIRLQFHFRPTAHPQNVRRRIKQLKDYISVTSDWISYALIDDITDAFGPLIQSIEYEVDSIDELVLILKEAEQSDMLRRYVAILIRVLARIPFHPAFPGNYPTPLAWREDFGFNVFDSWHGNVFLRSATLGDLIHADELTELVSSVTSGSERVERRSWGC